MPNVLPGLGRCPFYCGGSVAVDFLFIVTSIVGVCNCSMFCCTLLCVRSSIAIILMGKRELVALLNLSSWCLVMVERLLLTVPQGCLRFLIVVFPDHTYLLFLIWVQTISKDYLQATKVAPGRQRAKYYELSSMLLDLVSTYHSLVD